MAEVFIVTIYEIWKSSVPFFAIETDYLVCTKAKLVAVDSKVLMVSESKWETRLKKTVKRSH